MSEILRNLDPIGYRIEAGPNISSNPEVLSGTDMAPDSPPKISLDLHGGFGLGVAKAFQEALQNRHTTSPPEFEVY